jgi:hypothetical protein
MGCGCNKAQAVAVSQSNRNTLYQVINDNHAVVGEFANLREARQLAVEIAGRVKVTSTPK